MGLIDELDYYRQPNGLYSNQKRPENDSSGNCIAISSLAIWLAFRLGEFKNSTQALSNFLMVIKSCRAMGHPGLFNRSPTKIGDQEGWDDYVILLSTKTSVCDDILYQSKQNFCSFNNVYPGKFSWQSWFARYPQFLAHLKFCNYITPNIFFKVLWCIAVFFSSFSKSPTSIVLNFMMIKSIDQRSFICTITSRFWSWMMRKCNMKEIVGLWLSIERGADGKDIPNMEHPIVKYWT